MEALKLDVISLKKFATYAAHTHQFDPGATLFLGKNGAGKSTVIEAVCWVIYGKSLRGKLPGPGAIVDLTGQLGLSTFLITRKRTKSGTELQVTFDGNNLTAQTATETQTKLDQMFGPWERFRATRLFSRAFMSRFGASTPKVRMELVEGILGHERFDQAHHLAKTALKEHEQTLGTHRVQVARLDSEVSLWEVEVEKLAGAEEQLQAAEAALAKIGNNKAAAAAEVNMKGALRGAKVLAGELSEVRAEVRATMAEVMGQIRETQAKAARIAHISSCPVCLQDVGPEVHQSIQSHYSGLVDGFEARMVELRAKAEEQTNELEEVERDVQDLEANQTKAQADSEGQRQAQRQAEDTAAMARAKVGNLHGLQKNLAKAAKAKAAGELNLRLAEDELEATQALVTTFGPRGARMMLLGNALKIMEAQANIVLRELGGGLQVKLSTQATQKSGKEVDELSVTIVGAGGGDYDGTSEGERSRVDVALMVGVAQLLGGTATGWLAFDEIFDTLDPEGVEAVSEYLKNLAMERQCLVISHHPEMRNLFPRADVWTALKTPQGSILTR